MFDEMKLTKNEMWLLKTNLSEKANITQKIMCFDF